MNEFRLTTEQCATLACLLEVTAPKPGNVHRGADFEDLTFLDFQLSALAIGPAMAQAAGRPLGDTVLDAVSATRRWVRTNTNLGLILLLAPLAAAPPDVELRVGLGSVLDSLTPRDARQVYRAIRLAQPGALGQVDQLDVAEEAPADLLCAMRSAAARDMIARQYSERFRHVFEHAAKWLVETHRREGDLMAAIIHTHVRMLAAFPDSLIARKCGQATADQASARAQGVLESGGPGQEAYHQALADLDFWLRSDGHRRNPGTTADMIGAGLFVALRQDQITLNLDGLST